MSTLFLQFIGWFSLPILAVLVGLLVWRRVPREFPHFFNYIVLAELVGLARLWAYHVKPRAYPPVYWTSDVLLATFAMLATYELLVKRLFPRFYAIRFYQFLFPAAAIVIVLFLVPAVLQTRRISLLLLLIHGLVVLRVCVLLFFGGLMVFMGRQWTRYELGIAMGLVLEASGLLAISAIWTQKPFVRHFLDQLPVVSYDLACVIWLISFLKPESAKTKSAAAVSPELVHNAKLWQENLKDTVINRKSN